MSFTNDYLREVRDTLMSMDTDQVEACVDLLAKTRDAHGRVFVLGVGGSAANASHAVNDFRKLAGIEAYAPTDNVAELTARTNDDGWASVFESWLRTSHLGPADLVLVLSVGGGDVERNVSANLVYALAYTRKVGAQSIGIVGRADSATARTATACIVVPTINAEHLTPHAESLQSILCHLLVWHPSLAV